MVNHFSCFVEKQNRGKDHISWRKTIKRKFIAMIGDITVFIYDNFSEINEKKI